MIKLPFGEHKGTYTVQRSYQRSSQLSATWRWLGGLIVGVTVLTAFLMAVTWKNYHTTVFNNYVFEQVIGYSIGSVLSNAVVLIIISALLCYIMSHVFGFAKESRTTWPNVLGGTVSVFVGTLGLSFVGPMLRDSLRYLPLVDSPVVMYEKYELLELQRETVETLFRLYGYATYVLFCTLMLLTMLFFLLAFYGLATVNEVFRRSPLPAKTNKQLRVEFYDNLSRTRKEVLKIVLDNLRKTAYTKDEVDGYYEQITRTVRGEITMVLYEGDEVVAFLVRSHDYAHLQAVWVAKGKQHRQFGAFLLNDYLKNAEMRVDPELLPLKAYVEPHNPQFGNFLADNGWVNTNITDDRGYAVYELPLAEQVEVPSTEQ